MSLDNRGIGRKGGISGRGSIIFLILLSFVLIYITESGPRLLNSFRQFTYDIVTPVTELIGKPFDALRRTSKALSDYTDLVNENAKLKVQLDELRLWEDRALRLQAQIARYETLLNVKLDDDYNYATARVVADIGGPFVRTVLLNAGEEKKLKVGQAVIGASGFIGQIVSVGSSSSRVLLLTDLNSRIPVQLEPSGMQAILTGDNTGEPILDFFNDEEAPKSGARVVTSGYGGQIPPGISIGDVRVTRDGQAKVSLRENLSRLNYVRILDFVSIKTPESETQLPDVLVSKSTNTKSQGDNVTATENSETETRE